MLEKEVEWWSLPSALTIYCYCLHRLIVSLKFVSTKRDNYPLTLNCTEAHVQCNLRQITFKIFWLTFKKCFIMLYELVKKGSSSFHHDILAREAVLAVGVVPHISVVSQ